MIAGRGSDVCYRHPIDGYRPAKVINRPTAEAPLVNLVIFHSDKSLCTEAKNGVGYGPGVGQWLWPGEEPDPVIVQVKPRPPHEVEEEQAAKPPAEEPDDGKKQIRDAMKALKDVGLSVFGEEQTKDLLLQLAARLAAPEKPEGE